MPSAGRHARLFVLALVSLVLAGTVALATPWVTNDGSATHPVDALFTSVSAACVTGLVTVDTADHWNIAGQIIILLLMQAGGLGFMVGASVLLRMLQRGSLGLSDTLLLRDGQPTLSIREAAELSGRIVRFTFAVEAAGALLLAIGFARDMPLGRALWFGLFHSVSAFTNGSFDLMGGFVSLREWQTSPLVNVTVMLLIQAGALSWVVLADAARTRHWRRMALETRVVLLLNGVLIALGSIVFLVSEWNGAMSDTPEWSRPMTAVFHSVTARTAGFSTVDFARANDATLFLWTAIMFVGGASGSTAGGAKLTTVGIVLVATLAALRGEREPQVFGRRIPIEIVFRAVAVVVLMLLAAFLSGFALAAVETMAGNDAPFIAKLFEAMSALVTCGASTGITPGLSTAGKLILCATMLFGRVGPLTAVYALQRRQKHVHYRFPEEAVRIG